MSTAKQHFFVLGPGRCRTAWFSAFLTQGDVFCYHELSRLSNSLGDFKARLERPPQRVVGTADSGLLFNIDWLLENYPEARYVFIVRPLSEVKRSFETYFETTVSSEALSELTEIYHKSRKKLEGRAVFVHFDHLFKLHIIERLRIHCSDEIVFDSLRYALFKDLVIQVSPTYDLNYISGFTKELVAQRKTEECQLS